MADSNFLDKAIGVVKEATEADSKKDYPEAYRLYTLALKHFMFALKYEKNENYKESIRAKVNEYLNRAEELKKVIEAGKNKKAAADGGKGDPLDDEKSRFRSQLENTIIGEKPDVKWDDVVGLETAKEMLKEALFIPLKFPQMFQGKRKPWKGILLYGPPGTGKSFIAKAVATEAESTFFSVAAADLVNKWVGEGEKLVHTLFEMAREKAPSIIFIDELDALMSSRSAGALESSNRMLTQFLIEMDGMNTRGQVLVLGATNVPWSLDGAILRRFQKRIFIDLPDENARARIFRVHIGTTPNTMRLEDYQVLAKRSPLYSGSDIGVVVQDALMQPVRKVLDATHFKRIACPDRDDPSVMRNDYLTPCSPGEPSAIEMDWNDVPSELLYEPPLTRRDCEKSLSLSRPSVREEDRVKAREFTEMYGIDG